MNLYGDTPSKNHPPNNDAGGDVDAELLEQARAGDEAAFAKLFRRHYPSVRGMAARILLDLSAAEDVAQETFVRAARLLAQITDGSGLRSWLYRAAINLCRDRLRSQKRRLLREEEFMRLCGTTQEKPDERAVRIIEILRTLPATQREAVVLVYYENLDHATAARAAGCAASTLSWRLMLARRRLRQLLQ